MPCLHTSYAQLDLGAPSDKLVLILNENRRAVKFLLHEYLKHRFESLLDHVVGVLVLLRVRILFPAEFLEASTNA